MVMSDGMEGMDEQLEKQEGGAVVIYMLTMLQEGGYSTWFCVFNGHVQLSTLLCRQQCILTVQQENTDLHSGTCIHLSQLCFNGRMSWLAYCGLLVSKRVMCHMAGMESSVL